MLADLRNRRSEIFATARTCGALRVRVFGSVARRGATETSDIDFLVDLDDLDDLDDNCGLFDLGGLLMDLQELLGHNVDIVAETGLRARVAQRVLDDAVEL